MVTSGVKRVTNEVRDERIRTLFNMVTDNKREMKHGLSEIRKQNNHNFLAILVTILTIIFSSIIG